MPSYKDKDGRWRYRFAFNGKRYSGSTAKGHNTKKASDRLERDLLDKLEARRFLGTMPKVREFAVTFLDHQNGRTKPLTYKQQSATINNHIVPVIGKLILDQVDKKTVDGLTTDWLKNSKPKTINTRLGTLRRMLSLAVEWNILGSVPRITFMKQSNAAPRFLSDAEAVLLLDAAQPQWREMILVGLRTGLRVGELRGLQWNDVDLDRRVLKVRRTEPGRPTMDATSPKSNRERTVPLTADAIRALTKLRPEKPRGHEFVWPALLKRAKETRLRCRSEKGCWHGIDFAADAAGLSWAGWHTLRHTFASQLVMRGVPLRLIQKWLGHASIKETEKYSHLSPDFGDEAASLLDFPITPEMLRQAATKSLPEGARERNNSGELPTKA